LKIINVDAKMMHIFDASYIQKTSKHIKTHQNTAKHSKTQQNTAKHSILMHFQMRKEAELAGTRSPLYRKLWR
jgi:hypothetical protein